MNIGQAIREIRKNKGLRQNFVADKASISSEYLSNIESGTKVPTIAMLSKICQALEITVPYLLLIAVEDSIEGSVPKEKVEDLKTILQSLKPLSK